jgi:hypothetical protein
LAPSRQPNSNDNGRKGPEENEYIKRLRGEGELPNDITLLYGYVGTAGSEDILRLYKDINFNEYYEIKRTDIRYWKENDKDPFGGTAVFVDSDAEVKVVCIQVTRIRARFLAGSISKANIRRRLRKEEEGGPELSQDFGTCGGTCNISCNYSCDFTCNTCDNSCPVTCEGYTCFGTCPDATCYGHTCEYVTCRGQTCDGHTCNAQTCYYTCQATCDTCIRTCGDSCYYLCGQSYVGSCPENTCDNNICGFESAYCEMDPGKTTKYPGKFTRTRRRRRMR